MSSSLNQPGAFMHRNATVAHQNPKIGCTMVKYPYADPGLSLWHCSGPEKDAKDQENRPKGLGNGQRPSKSKPSHRNDSLKTEYKYNNIYNHSWLIRSRFGLGLKEWPFSCGSEASSREEAPGQRETTLQPRVRNQTREMSGVGQG